MKKYDNGIRLEKSALSNFAEKYVIEGKPGILPLDYFVEKASQIKEFLRNHRNIKVRMVLVCYMQEYKCLDDVINKSDFINKAYFTTETFINLESTDVKIILSQMIN